MRCEAFLDYGTDNEHICDEQNAKICDQCEHWFCDKHARVMDGDSTKYHTHFVCWASKIFEMFKRKEDIPKRIIDFCPKCKIECVPEWIKDMPKTELYPVEHKDFQNVCGLCKSDIMDENKK